MRIFAVSTAKPGLNAKGIPDEKNPVFQVINQREMVNLLRSRVTFGQKLLALLMPAVKSFVVFFEDIFPEKHKKSYLKYLKSSAAEIKEFLNFLKQANQLVKGTGIEEKLYAVPYRFDPDIKDGKKIYDPAVHSAVLALNQLFSKKDKKGNLVVDPLQVKKVYVVCSTPGALNPPLEDRIEAKLNRDGIVSNQITRTWDFEHITKACVGPALLLQKISSEKNGDVICVFVGINTIHKDEKDLTQLIAYGDDSAAWAIKTDEDSSGTITGKIVRRKTGEVDNVIHPLIVQRPDLGEALWDYFIPQKRDLAPKKVAVTIAEESPKRLINLLKDNDVHLSELDFIVFSQTSKTVVDRKEMALADYFREEELCMESGVRTQLKLLVSDSLKNNVPYETKHKQSEIVHFFFQVIKQNENNKEKLLLLRQRLYEDVVNRKDDNDKVQIENEIKLFDMMLHLNKAVCRTYDHKAYTGVASTPGVIAELAEQGVIDLDKHCIAIVTSGLGVNVNATIINAPKKTSPNIATVSRNGFVKHGQELEEVKSNGLVSTVGASV